MHEQALVNLIKEKDAIIKRQSDVIADLEMQNSVIAGMQEKIDLYREQLKEASGNQKELTDRINRIKSLVGKKKFTQALEA